jgi:hypothetical protein
MTDQDIVEIGQLIYNQWSEAATRLVSVREAENDGQPDWEDFQESRLEIATAEEKKWHDMKTRFIDEYRATINKAYGI